MSHIRKQIRNKIIATVTGLATTGDRVYSGYPYPAEETPCLFVYTPTESIELDDYGNDREQERRINVVIEAHCKSAAIHDEFDDISEEIETALFNDQFLAGLADGIDLDLTQEEITGGLEQKAGHISFSFTVHSRTLKGAPGTAI